MNKTVVFHGGVPHRPIRPRIRTPPTGRKGAGDRPPRSRLTRRRSWQHPASDPHSIYPWDPPEPMEPQEKTLRSSPHPPWASRAKGSYPPSNPLGGEGFPLAATPCAATPSSGETPPQRPPCLRPSVAQSAPPASSRASLRSASPSWPVLALRASATFESLETSPTLYSILRLAQALDVDPHELLLPL